jgi:hypothetical protein
MYQTLHRKNDLCDGMETTLKTPAVSCHSLHGSIMST